MAVVMLKDVACISAAHTYIPYLIQCNGIKIAIKFSHRHDSHFINSEIGIFVSLMWHSSTQAACHSPFLCCIIFCPRLASPTGREFRSRQAGKRVGYSA